MMIPDLDEDEAEDLTLQVAAAPKTTARRLQSLEQVIIISTRNQDVARDSEEGEETTEDTISLFLSREPCLPHRPSPPSPHTQLDHELKYAIPAGLGVDLSFLTASLVPPGLVHEDDTPWDFDTLLQEVRLDE
jgi:hypothetical protein